MWFWKSQTQIKLEELIEGQKELLRNQRVLARNQGKLSKNQVVLAKKLLIVENLVCDLLLKSKPGPVGITITGERSEEGMADIIKFSVSLPPKAAPDVVNRELTIVIGGGEPDVRNLDADVNVVEGLEGPQDAMVEVSLVDVDDGGNRSDASVASATLLDTVAPPQPGTLGIEVLGESFVDDEPVADEPVADEPVADEPVADEPVADEPVADEPVADEEDVDPNA